MIIFIDRLIELKYVTQIVLTTLSTYSIKTESEIKIIRQESLDKVPNLEIQNSIKMLVKLGAKVWPSKKYLEV